MSAACTVCNGSGATANPYIYDCSAPSCTAANDRSKLEAAMRTEIARIGGMDREDAAWWGYQAGKAAALEQAAKIVETSPQSEENMAAEIRRLKP